MTNPDVPPPPPDDQWQPYQQQPYQQQPYQQQPGYGVQDYGVPGAGMPGSWAPVGEPPDNYLVWAILSTVFCFWPTGIVAIVNAANVNSRWAVGDVQGAHQAAQSAKTWAMWSAIIVGIIYAVFIVGYLLFFLVFGAAVVGIGNPNGF